MEIEIDDCLQMDVNKQHAIVRYSAIMNMATTCHMVIVVVQSAHLEKRPISTKRSFTPIPASTFRWCNWMEDEGRKLRATSKKAKAKAKTSTSIRIRIRCVSLFICILTISFF